MEAKTKTHFLPIGELSFEAPLTYYIGETDSRGIMNMTKENAKKKFIVIEWMD